VNLLYEIALSQVPGIGPIKAKNLIRYCGSAEAVFTEKKSRLLKIPEIGEAVIKAIAEHNLFERAEQELDYIARNDIRALYYQNPDFPRRLLHCPDHPLLLFAKGNVDFDFQYVLSIVGTRKATPYGKRITAELVEFLKPYPVLIVSGLAYGIDIAAHRACIKNEMPTVGVVAHGVDQIYPREHENIARRMFDNGGILTEFMTKTKPDRENFPKRNRIVAGVADVTIVVESQEQGGALITGKLAADYNRDVFAVPGRIGDPFSMGCLKLIEQNGAAVYAGPEHFVNLMGWKPKIEQVKKERQLGLDYKM
jgi:DNA processing protein